MTAKKMFHAVDPKKEIHDSIGDGLTGVDLFNNQVLVAIYVRPEKTASGIILTDKYRDEDKYQGKVGLVIKKGPMAFVGEDEWFKGVSVEEGDWIIFRPSDGWQINVNGVPCRMLNDVSVKGKLPNPDLVW
jgi:co-chaperonin GroES (HSP10)